jgi:WS/DGAT/MGAT family acyltransferase
MALVPTSDSLFLWIETPSSPTHYIALEIFRLPDGAGREVIDDLYAAMTEESKVKDGFRRRPYRSFGTGGQYGWAEDDKLDMSKHVIRHTLPKPGRMRELLDYIGKLHSTVLDRSRPLWEGHLIDGLDDNRFALLTKASHAYYDGVNMTRHLLGGFSTDPTATNCTAPWIVSEQKRSAADDSTTEESRSVPGQIFETGKAVLSSVGAFVRAGTSAVRERELTVPFTAPDTILNQKVDSSRRFVGDAWPIERLRKVARATGTSSNDVAMSMCGSALRSYLTERDALPNRSLVAMVPVSTSGTSIESTAKDGNAFAAALCALGTELSDPMERLQKIHKQMDRNKELVGNLDATSAQIYSTANMLSVMVVTLPGMRPLPRPGFNLVVSNVPGIRKQLYYNGCALTDFYPVSVILDGQGLNMTMMNYLGQLAFGLVCCDKTVPHLQRMLVHLESGLAAMESAAGL